MTKSCVQQSQAWNGHAHASGYLHRLNYGYTETLTNESLLEAPVVIAMFVLPTGPVTTVATVWNQQQWQQTLALNGGPKVVAVNDLRATKAPVPGCIKGYYMSTADPALIRTVSQIDNRCRINPQECALVGVD